MQYLINENECKTLKEDVSVIQRTLASIERAIGNSTDKALKGNTKPLVQLIESKIESIGKILK